ncbi:hypothetical protein NDU88_004813 [Pleurodeles waltl]|uniref:Uncharacterized protein n=1 Tax=Pleurodeles waltl TaxID=8319 RepID=A0AAV7W616_PLEWA|nr:hypothetical protein NDU88_004813 [Pleurodeles waltl]
MELLAKQHQDRTNKRDASPLDQDLPMKQRTGLGTTTDEQFSRDKENSAPHMGSGHRAAAARTAPPTKHAANQAQKRSYGKTATHTSPRGVLHNKEGQGSDPPNLPENEGSCNQDSEDDQNEEQSGVHSASTAATPRLAWDTSTDQEGVQ